MSPRARQYHMSSTPPPGAIMHPTLPPKKTNSIYAGSMYISGLQYQRIRNVKNWANRSGFPSLFSIFRDNLGKNIRRLSKYIFKMYKYLKLTRLIALNPPLPPPPPSTMLINVVTISKGYDLNPTLYWGERGGLYKNSKSLRIFFQDCRCRRTVLNLFFVNVYTFLWVFIDGF